MKKLLFIAMFLAAFSASYAQEDNPIHWYISSKRLSGNMYELHFKALIDPPYHIYAQANKNDIALPTKIIFTRNIALDFQGDVKENGTVINHVDKTSGETISYYAQEVDFVQTIRFPHKGKTVVKGFIKYMACTDDHCLPEAKRKFSITIGK